MKVNVNDRKTQLIIGGVVLGLFIYIYYKKSEKNKLTNRERELIWKSKMAELSKPE